MQRKLELMRKQVENWQKSDVTDVTAKVVIYEAFVEGKLEAPKHLARTVHGLHFEPKYEDFRPDDLETIECIHFGVQGTGPIPQFRATAKLSAPVTEAIIPLARSSPASRAGAKWSLPAPVTA
jgi:hypothetical protein